MTGHCVVRLLTPSTYGRTWSQKKPQISTTRLTSLSSSIPVSFALRVTIPEEINAVVSFSNVAKALEGAVDTTLWMCLFTRMLRSSLKTENTTRFLRLWRLDFVATYTGTRNGSPLNKGKTWMWRAPQGLSGDALGLILCTLCGRLVEEAAACAKGIGFKWTKFPKRCISRETSFESYVRPIEPCEGPGTVSRVGQGPKVKLWACVTGTNAVRDG